MFHRANDNQNFKLRVITLSSLLLILVFITSISITNAQSPSLSVDKSLLTEIPYDGSFGEEDHFDVALTVTNDGNVVIENLMLIDNWDESCMSCDIPDGEPFDPAGDELNTTCDTFILPDESCTVTVTCRGYSGEPTMCINTLVATGVFEDTDVVSIPTGNVQPTDVGFSESLATTNKSIVQVIFLALLLGLSTFGLLQPKIQE